MNLRQRVILLLTLFFSASGLYAANQTNNQKSVRFLGDFFLQVDFTKHLNYRLNIGYDVKNIIRIGSCGSIDPELHVRDIIIAQGACTNGSYANQYELPGTFCPIASFELLEKAVAATRKAGARFKVGNILSSDMFYDDAASAMRWSKMGVLGVEMESAALYCNAARLGKNGLCICTVSDSFNYPEENTTAEERQNSFTKMMEIALEIA